MIFNRDDVASPSTKKTVSTINDPEFGPVAYRRSAQAHFVRIRVTEDGAVRATLPKRAPLYLARELLDSSRLEIRKMVATQKAKRVSYHDGMMIGRSHRLQISYSDITAPRKKISGQTIDITLPENHRGHSDLAHDYVSVQVKQALRREAAAYLPRRLRYLANTYGFSYTKERFGNQKGRWGSCSASGTISLNVALMNLPLEMIDYVLIHELAHTKQMNHSPKFWEVVEGCMPDFRVHRKMLKTMSPIC